MARAQWIRRGSAPRRSQDRVGRAAGANARLVLLALSYTDIAIRSPLMTSHQGLGCRNAASVLSLTKNESFFPCGSLDFFYEPR
jgi:hypothetical protein